MVFHISDSLTLSTFIPFLLSENILKSPNTTALSRFLIKFDL